MTAKPESTQPDKASETPRTDEIMRQAKELFSTVDVLDEIAVSNINNRIICMLERHARTLERELAAARAELAAQKNTLGSISRRLRILLSRAEAAEAKLLEYERDTRRYRYWRENCDEIADDGDGIIGVAFCHQIPIYGLPGGPDKEESSAELFDKIADAALAKERK